MTALAEQPPLIHDANAISGAHRGQPVSNNQYRHFSFKAGKRLAYVFFTLRIQGAGRLIQQQAPRSCQ